jgi:hypothetical protein
MPSKAHTLTSTPFRFTGVRSSNDSIDLIRDQFQFQFHSPVRGGTPCKTELGSTTLRSVAIQNKNKEASFIFDVILRSFSVRLGEQDEAERIFVVISKFDDELKRS